jgi:RNA-binding protein Nova
MDSTLQLASSQGLVLPPRSSAGNNILSQLKTSLTFYLPDDDVGAILGKKGQNLAEIQQVLCLDYLKFILYLAN